MIETAAKLIKCVIKAINQEKECYPYASQMAVDIALQFIPETLHLLLSGILSGRDTSIKVASLGQSVMQAAWPMILPCPLQFHHHFGSRFLIDTLNNH